MLYYVSREIWLGNLKKFICIDQSRFYIFSHLTFDNSKIFNFTSKYFSLFNNKPPSSWVTHIASDFLTCCSCSYYSSMVLFYHNVSKLYWVYSKFRWRTLYLNLGAIGKKYNIFFWKWLIIYKLIQCSNFSQCGNILATMSSCTKTIFKPPFEFRSFLNRGKWYASILNSLSGKLESSLILSVQSVSILHVEMISLFFSFKKFLLR